MHTSTQNQNAAVGSRQEFMACMSQGLRECLRLVDKDEPLPVAHRRFLECQASRPSNGIAKCARNLLSRLTADHPASTARAAQRAGA